MKWDMQAFETHNSFPVPANDTGQQQTPQESRAERLVRAGLKLIPIRVCKLSGEENTFVRTGFNMGVRRAFMQRLATLASRETENLFGDQPPALRERIRKKHARALFSYDKHHAIPVSLCPIELSPHSDWEQTLDWWRDEAHLRVHAVPPLFHEEIHAFINTQIQQVFGTKALSFSESRKYEGEILIPYKPASVWLPPSNSINLEALVSMPPRAPNRKVPKRAAPTLSLRDSLLARHAARQRRTPLARVLP